MADSGQTHLNSRQTTARLLRFGTQIRPFERFPLAPAFTLSYRERENCRQSHKKINDPSNQVVPGSWAGGIIDRLAEKL